MSDFKEWAMARKTQGPNGEAASGIQTSVSNPRPPAAQAGGTTSFKEWAMRRKAQSLTGRERIVQPYQQTNAGQTARKNAARPQITTPYTVHLDQVNTPQEQFDTAVRRLKTLYQHQNDLASRSATMDPAEYSRQWNETQKQVGQMEALKTSAANQRYRQKNEAALAQINADASLSSDYRSTENIQSDLDKITAIADDAMNHNGGAEIVEYKTELAEKYGLTQQAIDNYAIGGADYHPAGSGITNLWQLYEQLDAQRREEVKSLQDRGYDYERLQAYKKEKRDAGEYAVQSRQWQQYAEEHPRLASLETTLVSPFQGIDFAKAAVQGIRHGNPEDEENYVPLNLYNMDATNFVSQVRGQVSKNLGEKYDLEIFDQNVAQFLYHTGMSIADSALLIATMGSGAGLLMGTSAAANGTRDAVERGASSSQAILTGLAQGAAELIFEKFSIDQLLKPKNVQSVRRLLQETLKQAGVEASEEGATEIANILTDAAIMGESSNFSISVENYKAQGMSESEAQKRAYLDMIGQVGWAAAGGALSGGVMGGFVNTARLGLGNQTENTADPETDRQGQARQKMAQPNVIQSNSDMPWAESDTAQSADSRLEQSQQKQSEARFSIQYDRDNNPYVLVEDDILEGVPRNEWVRTVKDNLRQRFPNGVTVGNNVININQQSRREMTFSNYMKQLFWQEPQLYSDKLRATNNADEILQASRNWVNEALLHRRKDTITDFARGEVLLRIGNNDYRAQVVVGNRGNGNLLLYDIINLAPTEIQLHKTKVDAADTTNTPKEPRGRQTASTKFNVAQDSSGVNGDLAFRQTGERTELPPLRSRDDNTNSSSGVLWAGSDTAQSTDSRLEQSQQKQGEARFSIQYDRDNNPYVLVEDDILEGVPRNEWVRTVKDNLRQRFPNGVTVGNNVIEINAQSRNEMTYSGYTKHLMRTEPELYADKLRAINNSDEVLRASRNYVNEALAHPRRDNIQEFARGEVLMQVGDKGYSAQVVVAMRSNGKLLLYDILQMEPAKIQTKNKKSNAVIAKNPSPGTDRSTASGFNTNISEIGSGVNGNLAFRQTGERTELPPLRSRDDNTNSSSGVLWAGSDTSQSADADSSPQGEPLMRRVAFSGAAKPGLVKDQTYRKARYTAKTERTLDTIAKAAGVQVRIVDRVDVQDADGNVVGDANARYIPETATIEISRSTQDPVRAVFVHEVVHRIRDTAPEAYTQMAKYVVDTMDENRYTDAIDTRAEWYRTNDASYLQEEVVADAFGRVLSDSAALDRFVQSNRNIAQRILDALQDFIDAIRGRTGDGKLSDAKAQEVQEFVDSADEMVRLLEHALKWTDGQKNTSSMGGKAKHSLNADFGRQFDAWLSQNNEQQRLRSNGYFLVGTTSDALKSIGIDDYRIYFGQGKIAKIMQKHPAMTAEVIKSVPDILEHPVLVMQSQTVANRITLFGETVDANGKPVLVALELSPQNKRGEVLDFVVITSAYGKNNAQHLIDASDILYIDPDKKRTNSWLRLLRLQLPSRVTSYGSVQRVTLLNRDVNGNLTFGERGGKTDMQLAFEKAMAEKRRTRFSLKTPIEGSADLIALHNLTEQNLLDALRLGGMPMPSIAVTKTDLPHLEFGDITLVLDKNSIDPGADSRNRVYGADIGSSIAPEEAQTLEEIVEAMKQSRRLPEGVGAMSLQAAVAPSYESLQQLWKDSGRLGRMEGPEFQADLEAVNRQIEEILRQVRQGQVDAEAADAAVALRNAAGSTKTEQAIAQSFAEDGYALDSKLVAQIQTAFQAAAELPTEYFEAKPERVVGFDEVLAAVVPDDSSRELLAGLDAAGVQTLKYRTGDDADRVEQVNSVQQARFSPGSAQKRTGRTNSDSGVIWTGSDTSQSASRPAPLKGSRSNSSSGVLWRGSETAMDSPDQAVYNEAGKGQSTSSSNSSSGILWAGSEKAPVEKAHSVREINEPKSVKRQLKRLSPEAKKGYDKAVTAIKSGDTRGLNDHPLRGNRSGQRAIDIKGTGKGRGAGRIVYKYGENGEIDIIEILMDHDY